MVNLREDARVSFYGRFKKEKEKKKKVLNYMKLEYYKEILDFSNIEYHIIFLITKISDQQCHAGNLLGT